MMKSVALLLLFLAPVMAYSEEIAKPSLRGYFAPMVGYSMASQGSGNSVTYGLRVGMPLTSEETGVWSLGLMFSHASLTNTGTFVLMGFPLSYTETDTFTPIMLELVSRKAWGTGLYLGGRVGLTMLSAEIKTTNTYSGTATSFSFAPVVGYEYRLSEKIAANLDFSWVGITGGTLDFTTVGAIKYKALSAALFQAGIVLDF